MSNHHLRNKELSLKAKGLLSQMLSLPEDWDYTLAGLSHINRESIDAIRTAVWELEKAGYITRRQGRDEKGKMAAIEYTIYEQPQPRHWKTRYWKIQQRDKPVLENPTTENPTSDNPTQIIKKNKELTYQKKKNQIRIYQIPIPFLSFPLTPLLWGTTRQSRRNGSERKRQHRAHLRFTRKSSRTISSTTFSNRICPTTMTG